MINKRNDLGQSVLIEDDDIKQRVELKYSKYEYVGGYTGADGYLYLRCKDCGRTKKHYAGIIKPSRHRNINCPVCNEVAEQYRKEVKQKEKERKKHERELSFKYQQIAIKVCPVCNTLHTNRSKYCTDKCFKYMSHKSNEDRRLRLMGKTKDTSITLKGLISRRGLRCAICGELVDINDYEMRGQVFIAGNNYPSIDHIIPLAKGGAHQWDNVQVAHRICNSVKRDKIV